MKSGFTVVLAPAATTTASPNAACNGTYIPTSAYYANAIPVSANSTGTRAFDTDPRGTIFQKACPASGACVANGNPIPSTALVVQ